MRFNFFLENKLEDKITLDQSTSTEIPYHLHSCLSSLKDRRGFCTQFNAMLSLVISTALECGFIGDWNRGESLSQYVMNWSYSFDRNILIDLSNIPKDLVDDGVDEVQIRLSYTLSRRFLIRLDILKSADLIIIVARHCNENSTIKSTKSVAISVSRYVIRNRLSEDCYASSFQNLKELSIKLKNEIFLPLRDEIYTFLDCKMLYPSLLGIPDDILLLIFKRYLKTKDICSLSLCCRSLHKISSPYLRNKSKIE